MNTWDRIKLQAKMSGKQNDWAYIIQKYRESGGTDKMIELVINMKKSLLLGQSDTGKAIVKSLESDDIYELTDSEYTKSRKLFKSCDSNFTSVKRLIRRSDGTSYEGVVYILNKK